jgi:hypothetical protein
MSVFDIFSIWMFVFEHKFDRDVIENLNDLNTKVMILCLWISSCSEIILLNVEWEIMIWLDLIHDFFMYIMFIFFFKSYFRHDIIVFVNFAQLCCRNLISWIIVLLIRLWIDRFSRFDFDSFEIFAIRIICSMCFATVRAFWWYMRTRLCWLAY